MTVGRGLIRTILILAVAGLLEAGPAPARTADPAQTYTFAFHDADISQVAEAILGNTLGLTSQVRCRSASNGG
jgi:hypothetical protein